MPCEAWDRAERPPSLESSAAMTGPDRQPKTPNNPNNPNNAPRMYYPPKKCTQDAANARIRQLHLYNPANVL